MTPHQLGRMGEVNGLVTLSESGVFQLKAGGSGFDRARLVVSQQLAREVWLAQGSVRRPELITALSHFSALVVLRQQQPEQWQGLLRFYRNRAFRQLDAGQQQVVQRQALALLILANRTSHAAVVQYFLDGQPAGTFSSWISAELPEALLRDLLEQPVTWDLQLQGASSSATAQGYRLEVKLQMHKWMHLGTGTNPAQPQVMHSPVLVTVRDERDQILHQEHHPITELQTTLTLELAAQPALVTLDEDQGYLDRHRHDNQVVPTTD